MHETLSNVRMSEMRLRTLTLFLISLSSPHTHISHPSNVNADGQQQGRGGTGGVDEPTGVRDCTYKLLCTTHARMHALPYYETNNAQDIRITKIQKAFQDVANIICHSERERE
jgi:hypothetical protein